MLRRVAVLMMAAAVFGCRGQESKAPPVHFIPDMDWQPKYEEQGQSAFFDDGRAMRLPPEGTIAVGSLQADDGLSTGKVDGAWLQKVPDSVVDGGGGIQKLLAKGQARYNIYCTPCHAQTGAGNGLVWQHGYPVQPSNLASDHTRAMTDGELYDAVKNGVRNMPAYGHQIPESDRWAIVSWVRVLQRSQHAQSADVPPGQSIEPQEESK